MWIPKTFAVYVASWYLSSVATSTTAKKILTAAEGPMTLTLLQFLMISVFIGAYGFATNEISKIDMRLLRIVVPISSFRIAGHILSTIAISYIPVSFSSTIKVLRYCDTSRYLRFSPS